MEPMTLNKQQKLQLNTFRSKRVLGAVNTELYSMKNMWQDVKIANHSIGFSLSFFAKKSEEMF